MRPKRGCGGAAADGEGPVHGERGRGVAAPLLFLIEGTSLPGVK